MHAGRKANANGKKAHRQKMSPYLPFTINGENDLDWDSASVKMG